MLKINKLLSHQVLRSTKEFSESKNRDFIRKFNKQQFMLKSEDTDTREFPKNPRVGVGVVVLRPKKDQIQVLLIQRGTEPAKGMWSLPGGAQELGESIVECAVREVYEECNIQLLSRSYDRYQDLTDQGRHKIDLSEKKKVFSQYLYQAFDLQDPTPFTAADAMYFDDKEQRYKFHYMILEVAAVPKDIHQEPHAASDISQAQYVDVTQVDSFKDLTVNTAQVIKTASTLYRHWILGHFEVEGQT